MKKEKVRRKEMENDRKKEDMKENGKEERTKE